MLGVAGRMWVVLLVLCWAVLGGGCLDVLLGWWRLVVGTVRARKARPQQLLTSVSISASLTGRVSRPLLHDGAKRDYLWPRGGGGAHLCPSQCGRESWTGRQSRPP